jgi:hypothetical protein
MSADVSVFVIDVSFAGRPSATETKKAPGAERRGLADADA